ncbi:hypothetical protein OPV22_017700 [Ensete ventricosum]|uniref:Structural maintenance of chromosomes protein 5 n=1 Tax=Ensete ventricosum TaxID=4639 RepID=A0AAV8PFI3_ENSVE|nr:hypothetical protein OPV22_017700 [Ensete ventricosum]
MAKRSRLVAPKSHCVPLGEGDTEWFLSVAHRAAKRSKLNQRAEDDYLPGNIVEIEIHNFMTYDRLKCQPGSRLNLVIGPNVSGKSSLVCAIALAGEPQLLGGASSVGAFVKRGEESGYIKISLGGETELEMIVTKRKIDTRIGPSGPLMV